MSEYKKISELKATFENGDILVLSFNECHFAGFEPAMVYQLSYGSRYEGRYDDEPPTKEDEHYFMMCCTEYFPETMRGAALQAFNTRLNSNNPGHESDQGLSLDSFLVKKSAV